jgi:hypothetical protein
MSIDLTKLEAPLETVILPDGKEYQPIRFNGFMADLYRQMGGENGEGKTDTTIPWRLVQALLPTAPPEVVKALTVAQCAAVLAVAQGKVQAVLDAEKNQTGADLLDLLMAGPAVSVPETPSAPSSLPSPERLGGTFTR